MLRDEERTVGPAQVGRRAVAAGDGNDLHPRHLRRTYGRAAWHLLNHPAFFAGVDALRSVLRMEWHRFRSGCLSAQNCTASG